MPSKLLLFLLCIILLTACKKHVDQPISKEETPKEEAVKQPDWTAFRLPPGGDHTTIQFENGKQLQAYRKDTSWYIEGDIILVPWQVERLKEINSPASRSFLNSYFSHWHGGQVPYTISGSFSLNDRNVIMGAMADWQNNTSLNFIERTEQNAGTYPDYIEFVPSWGNTSHIGRTGGKQLITLYVDPVYGVHRTAITHEIGHALGFFHEHSRADRDQFIGINWNNIQPGMQHNFLTWAQRGLPGTDLGTFDFNSIMLYPSYITDLNFVFNTSVPAMYRWDGSTWDWNFYLSPGDTEAADFVYGPPFAKIEYVNLAKSSSWTWMLITEHKRDDVYVRLYVDEACTIPFYTLTAKTVEIQYHEISNGEFYLSHSAVAVPAGKNEVLIHADLVTRDYRVEWGMIVKNEFRSYQPENAFFRN